MTAGRSINGHRPGPPDDRASAPSPGPQGTHDSRVRLTSAVMYLIGITLGTVGCLGALLWAPLIWSTVAGLVVIAASFTVSGSLH